MLDGFAVKLEIDGANHLIFCQWRFQRRLVQLVTGLQVFHLPFRDSDRRIFRYAQRHLANVAKPHFLGNKRLVGFDRGGGFVEAEAPGQQLFTFAKADAIARRAQHYRDQTHRAIGGRGHQVMTGATGVTGFNAVNVQVGAPQQTVAVNLADLVEGELFFFMQRIFIRHVADQCLTQQRHITCGTVLPFRIQPVHRQEVGILQAQRFGVVVHQADKRILATRDIIGQRDAGVVARLNDDAFVELHHWHLVARLDKHQRGATQRRVTGCPGIFTYGDHVFRLDLAGLDRLANHVAGHDLGQAGGIEPGIGIALRQNFAAVVIHQHKSFGIDLRGSRRFRRLYDRRSQQQDADAKG
ncbi:hypothetical protein D3C80_1189360 [compost metagenome]